MLAILARLTRCLAAALRGNRQETASISAGWVDYNKWI
jgi:hypothetical protein